MPPLPEPITVTFMVAPQIFRGHGRRRLHPRHTRLGAHGGAAGPSLILAQRMVLYERSGRIRLYPAVSRDRRTCSTASNARNLWMSVGRRTLPAMLHAIGIEWSPRANAGGEGTPVLTVVKSGRTCASDGDRADRV